MWLVSLIVFVMLSSVGVSQDFINTGTIANDGTLQLINQVIGIPDSIDGLVEFTGSHQSVPAARYHYLQLSGNGTKTTTGGSFSVQKNLTIAAAVSLNITKGTFITLGDTLFETGALTGAIQKSVNLTGSTTSSNFGNIGAAISWSSNAPGITSVMRVSDSMQFGNGNQSIRRYYQIQPSDATATGTVTFKYGDNELNGHNESNLQLWRSVDNGQNWQRFEPVVDTLLNTITKSNVALTGRWTMADTVNAIGPLQGGVGLPKNIELARNQTNDPIILSTLDTLKVLITDIFGTPVKGVPVTFTISRIPQNAIGYSLGRVQDSTSTDGIARTVLTLGNKVGTYAVIASSGDMIAVDSINARHGPAQSLASLLFSLQRNVILSELDSLFTIEVSDIGKNPVPNALVKFTIDSVPSPSAQNQALSVETVRTDPFGRASTRLVLGSKVGIYGVKATVEGVSDSIHFYADAAVGTAVRIATTTAATIRGIVGTTIDPLQVTLFDAGDNPVDNDTVTYKISLFPTGSDTGRLSTIRVPTDLQGRASTLLTLGTKIGTYRVSAENRHVATPSTFDILADAAAANTLAVQSGNNQTMPIISTLANDFIAAVTDTFGNAVDSAIVMFTIDSINANGSGARLSLGSIFSDLNGLASTRLTLGTKTGVYRVIASVNGIPAVQFTAYASAGAAVSMAAAAGLNQVKPIFTNLDQPFTVRIVDSGGNGVPSKNVQFSITRRPIGDSSAVVSEKSNMTDSLGYASTRLTLGSKVGTYAVNASVHTPMSTTESVNIAKSKYRMETSSAEIETSFTAFARNGEAFVMTQVIGNQQVNPTETELDTAFVVAVVDRGGNPVVDDSVRFTVVSAPENATNQAVRDSIVTTDSNGIAKTFLTLGTREGEYVVTAAIGSVPADTFRTTAYFIYGDINKDIDINIADITSLIDILNKKSTATAPDSVKADFNRDGLIDTLDIRTIRETILDHSIYGNTVQPLAFLEEENNGAYIAPVVRIKKKVTASAKTVFEATTYGLRVNLNNDEPVRGVELRLRLNDSTINVNRINMIFKRAEMMDVFVSTKANEVRVVAYNLTNTEIQPDSGSIFRLPFITSLSMIDSTEVTIALQSNSAAPVNTEKVTAPVTAYPNIFRLSQNYPNPFNNSTTIEYDIPDGIDRTKTILQVYNVLGQRVKTLVSDDQQPGRYAIRWDGTNQNGNSVSSGVYIYRFTTKSHVGTRKMVFIK